MEWYKKILHSFNISTQCKRYNVKIWQCPQFLFLLMGIVIVATIVATYLVARKFVSPEIVALIVLGLAAVLFIISHAITSSFERVARSSKAKSEFISIMSHRLRSPLSAIKWHLEILADQEPGQTEVTGGMSLTEMNAQNEKMIRIVNDLLELSNIEDDNLMINKTNFNLKELAEETVQLQKDIPENPQIPITVSATDTLPDAFADRAKIQHVIFHLLDNAYRYSMKGGRISIVLEQLPKEIRFSVTDEGSGIMEEERKKIFNKFFRSKGKLHYQTEGTGIGLFIAKSIIERSKGKMGFISVEGRGSTFWFTLPVAKSK